jgi:hypothetical protein
VVIHKNPRTLGLMIMTPSTVYFNDAMIRPARPGLKNSCWDLAPGSRHGDNATPNDLTQ